MAKKDAASKALRLVAPIIFKEVFGEDLSESLKENQSLNMPKAKTTQLPPSPSKQTKFVEEEKHA